MSSPTLLPHNHNHNHNHNFTKTPKLQPPKLPPRTTLADYAEFDPLPTNSPHSIIPNHQTPSLNIPSAQPQIPPFDHLSQHTLISRSFSVQPQMSSRSHFFTEDSKTNLTTIAETIPRPFMFQAKFGSLPNWSLDIFALPHNAIRQECVHLYNILESIHARSNRVRIAELDEFATWWTTFEIFVIEYFDFEADVLFPCVFSKRDEEPDLIPLSAKTSTAVSGDLLLEGSLLARKEPLLESLRQINGTFELRRHVDPSDVFHTILEDVNEFVPKLMDYFHFQERHLPPIISKFYSPTTKNLVTKKYLTYIKHGEAPQMNIVILTRWMDRATREKWVRSNVRGVSRLFYTRWEKKCNKEHAHIAFRFHRRLLRSVRNVAATRLRRRNDFGEDIEEMSFGSLASHTGSFKSLSLVVGSKGSSTLKSQRSKESSRSKGKVR